MIIQQEPSLSEQVRCAYLTDRMCRFEYFFARDVSAAELDALLSSGWRKFGTYYFRPDCPRCAECQPIRVPVKDFVPSKSQKRVSRTGSDVEVRFGPLEYRDEIYDIYQEHSVERFDKKTDRDDFYFSFYNESCPSLQSEYYYQGSLVAVGFLDMSTHALSSVYFIYKNEILDLSPGTLSALREIEYTASLGLSYYYLGYFIAKNASMSYKNRYYPHEIMDWQTGAWVRKDKAGKDT